MKFPLIITYPLGKDSDLINVVDAADQPIFGAAGCLPNHSNNLRADWQELVRRANAYDAAVSALSSFKAQEDKIAALVASLSSVSKQLEKVSNKLYKNKGHSSGTNDALASARDLIYAHGTSVPVSA